LRRDLQGPAYAVSDDVGVADDDLVRVLLLRRPRLVEVFLKGPFDARTVGAKLGRVGLPEVERRFRRKRSAFLQQLVDRERQQRIAVVGSMQGRNFGVALVVPQLVENDAGRLLGSRHGGGDDGVVLEADFAQAPSGQDQLLTAQPGQPLLSFAPLFRKVLAVSYEKDVPRAPRFRRHFLFKGCSIPAVDLRRDGQRSSIERSDALSVAAAALGRRSHRGGRDDRYQLPPPSNAAVDPVDETLEPSGNETSKIGPDASEDRTGGNAVDQRFHGGDVREEIDQPKTQTLDVGDTPVVERQRQRRR